MHLDIPEFTCPECNNPNCKPEDLFCHNCGAEIRNCCVNPECKRGGAKDPTDNVLPKDHCHCSLCGHPTRYMLRGMIRPQKWNAPEYL